MKIKEKYLEIIKWTVVVLLMALTYRFSLLSYGSFSPIKAHNESERAFHYGPSKIINTINLKGTKIYLCKYKDWISANTVNRGIIKWYPGGQVGGTPIDFKKPISFAFNSSSTKKHKAFIKIYGYVNNPEITTVLLVEDRETTTMKYEINDNRMFIFYWLQDGSKYNTRYLRGLNKDGEIIYEVQAY